MGGISQYEGHAVKGTREATTARHELDLCDDGVDDLGGSRRGQVDAEAVRHEAERKHQWHVEKVRLERSDRRDSAVLCLEGEEPHCGL